MNRPRPPRLPPAPPHPQRRLRTPPTPSTLRLALMNMFSHISTQVGAFGVNLSDQAVETRTALKTQAAAQEKAAKKLATDVDKKLDIHKQEFRGMLKNAKDTVEKLATRLASLEAEKEKKGDPDTANPDPWSSFNPKHSGTATATIADADASDFAPSSVIIKGWRRYGEQNALNTSDALALGHRVRGLLPEGLNRAILDIDAGYVCNRQVVFKIKPLAPFVCEGAVLADPRTPHDGPQEHPDPRPWEGGVRGRRTVAEPPRPK